MYVFEGKGSRGIDDGERIVKIRYVCVAGSLGSLDQEGKMVGFGRGSGLAKKYRIGDNVGGVALVKR